MESPNFCFNSVAAFVLSTLCEKNVKLLIFENMKQINVKNRKNKKYSYKRFDGENEIK